MGSACRCTTFQVPSSGRKIVVTRRSKGTIFRPSAKLGLVPLYPHNVDKFRSYILRYVLESNDLALSDLQRGTLHSRSNLLPSTHGRAEGVSEGDVFLMGEHHLVELRVPLHELP